MATKKAKLAPVVREVRDELKRRKWRSEDLAYHSGLSFKLLEAMRTGERPMTLNSAVKIEKAFGWEFGRLAKQVGRV